MIPLPHLVIEGLADSIDVLAGRRDDVALDDFGRRCTTREMARGLFAQRAAAEERAAAVHRRNEEKTRLLHEEALAGVSAGGRPTGGPSGRERSS